MKIHLAILINIILLTGATAQTGYDKHETTLGYGLASFHRLKNANLRWPQYKNHPGTSVVLSEDVLSDVLNAPGQKVYLGNKTRTGIFSASQSYYLFHFMAAGISVAYERAVSQPRYYTKSTPTIVGNYSESDFTIAPDLKFVYHRGRFLRLYSRLAIGYTFSNAKISGNGGEQIFKDNFMAFQVTPCGLHIGKKLSGFAEVGLGYRGLVNAGISYTY